LECFDIPYFAQHRIVQVTISNSMTLLSVCYCNSHLLLHKRTSHKIFITANEMMRSIRVPFELDRVNYLGVFGRNRLAYCRGATMIATMIAQRIYIRSYWLGRRRTVIPLIFDTPCIRCVELILKNFQSSLSVRISITILMIRQH